MLMMVLLESYFSHDWFELTVMTYRFRTQINIQFTLSLQICSDSSDNLYILPMVFGESFIASCVEITTPYSNLAKVSKYIVECCSHEKKKKYLAELNTRCRSLYQRPGLGQSGLSQYGSQMCQYPWLLNNR